MTDVEVLNRQPLTFACMNDVWTCKAEMNKNRFEGNNSLEQQTLPSSLSCTLAAMDAAVMWEEELSSVDAMPLSFFSSSSSSHCTPLSSVWRRGELLGGGERGGGGEGRSSSSSAASFTFTTASRRRSMACGSAGRMNWKHSWRVQVKLSLASFQIIVESHFIAANILQNEGWCNTVRVLL